MICTPLNLIPSYMRCERAHHLNLSPAVIYHPSPHTEFERRSKSSSLSMIIQTLHHTYAESR